MRELLERLQHERFREAMLWVLEDNPRTRRFYERAGWRLDGAVREETILDTSVREVRYRIALLWSLMGAPECPPSGGPVSPSRQRATGADIRAHIEAA